LILRPLLGGLELGRLANTGARIAVASGVLAAVSYAAWVGLDEALGRGLAGQIVSLTAALAAGGLVYAAVLKLLRVAELEQILRLVRRQA
jgi:hypothetical protein